MLVYDIRHLGLTPKAIHKASELLHIAEIYNLDVNIEVFDHEDSTIYLTGSEADEKNAVMACKYQNINVYREEEDG